MRIILLGGRGQMGQAVKNFWAEKKSEDVFYEPVHSSELATWDSVDLLIDFSHASALKDVLAYGRRTQTPLIIATTGHTEKDTLMIYETANEIPVFYTANFSLGVHILKLMSQRAVDLLGEKCDIEIIEKHHRHKEDAPSGTALMLFKALEEKRQALKANLGRKGKGKRSKNEMGIHAVRGGSIAGEHTLLFAMDGEHIELTHRGESKRLFAAGSYHAAQFIKSHNKGFYTMDDLLKGENE